MKVCVVCEKEITDVKKSKKVKRDFVINFIHKIKTLLGVAQNNELYVCSKDLDAQLKKREKYEKNVAIAAGISVIVFLILFVPSIFSGRLDIVNLVVAFLLAFLILFFVLFFRYTPSLEAVKK